MAQQLALIDDALTRYLKALIESGEPARAKVGLERLCKLYRQGKVVNPKSLFGIEQSVIGLAGMRTTEKVRRWSLNALARLGREEHCVPTIHTMLKNYAHEPQTSAAGIAALYRVCKRQSPADLLKELRFDPQMVALSALQHVDPNRLDLSSLPLDVQKASSDALRLALLVIGLNKSPDNLLNPRYADHEMVRVLGDHHDPLVSQYSIWAITENQQLGFADLGIPLANIQARPANVRSWVFQLFGMSPGVIVQEWDFLEGAIADPEAEARSGLAVGLRDTFIDGLESIVLDWLLNEPDNEVRSILVEHLVIHSKRSALYEEMAVQLFQNELPGSVLRQRMDSVAVGTNLIPRFRVMEIDAMADLFRGSTPVTNNNTINNYGSIQGGAISQSGQAISNGDTHVQHYNPQMIQAIHGELARVAETIRSSGLPQSEKERVLGEVVSAQTDPSPSKLQVVLDTIDRLGKLAGSGAALAPLAESLGRAAGLIQ